MNVRRLAASFATAVAVTGAILGSAGAASAEPITYPTKDNPCHGTANGHILFPQNPCHKHHHHKHH